MSIEEMPFGMAEVGVEVEIENPLDVRDEPVLVLADLEPEDVIGFDDLEGKSSLNGVMLATTGPMVNLNVHNYFNKPTTPGHYILEILHEISSSGAGTPALHSGTWPAGSELTIINKQYIRGAGGNGAGPGANNGSAGGTAVYTTLPTTIDNTGGHIWGGGGGGGGAFHTVQQRPPPENVPGGGGAGKVAGKGTTSALNGTLTSGGGPANGLNAHGGAGGAVGMPGDGGIAMAGLVGIGGRGGYAIQRNGHPITWLGGNDSTRVKGAIV